MTGELLMTMVRSSGVCKALSAITGGGLLAMWGQFFAFQAEVAAANPNAPTPEPNPTLTYTTLASVLGLFLTWLSNEWKKWRDDRKLEEEVRKLTAELLAARDAKTEMERKITQVTANQINLAGQSGVDEAIKESLQRVNVLPRPRPDGPAQTILVVEDDPMAAERWGKILTTQGYAVKFAGTIAAAVKEIRKSPHWIILDLGLSDGNGFEIMRIIRKEKLPIRVVVTTGWDDPKTLTSLARVRPDGVFTKPMGSDAINNLLSLLRRLAVRPSVEPSNNHDQELTPDPDQDKPAEGK